MSLIRRLVASATVLVASTVHRRPGSGSGWGAEANESGIPRILKVPASRRLLLAALLGFLFLAVYGSLVPFHWQSTDWQSARARLIGVLQQPISIESRSDWITNVLLFVPIGFFGTG